MKIRQSFLRAPALAALLFATCLTASDGVQVAIPAQADLQVSEDLGADVGAGAGADVIMNTLTDTVGFKNEVIVLRFDLTGQNRLLATNAWLKLINNRIQGTNQVLYFHGVTQGATGYNETSSTPGTSTDNDWPENETAFSTTPGLRFDADPATPGVDSSQTTFLGQLTVDNGSRDEGAEMIFSSPELQTFLVGHPDEVVTILVTCSTDNTSQKRFATKEATSLTTLLDPVPAGTYAPKLVLDLPGTTVKASADAQVNEINGSATTPTSNTGNGIGLNINVRYTNAANGERNEVIAMRFDLTNVTPGQITAADLRLVNHRTNTTSNRLHFYGVNDGATGYHAVDLVEGTVTDDDWTETSPVFSTMPGLEFDNNIATSGIRLDRVTDLGSTYLSAGSGNHLEGTELIFSTAKLKDFLANHPDRIVTILMNTDLPVSNNQKRFATKETTLLDGEVEDPENIIPAGTYAPVLNLQITPVDTFAITNFTLGSGTGQVTLTWESQPGQVFDITHSTNLQDGFPGISATGIPASAGITTSHTFANPVPAAPRLFFRVERP